MEGSSIKINNIPKIGFCGFVLLAICAVFGQPDSVGKKHGETAVLRILPSQATISSESEAITIEVEFRNTGSNLLRIAPVGIGAQISIISRPCNLKEGVRSENISRDPIPLQSVPKIVSVAPGQSYRQLLTLRLDDREFFKPGMYSITVHFSGSAGGAKDVYTSDLQSNEAFFEIAEPDDGGSVHPQATHDRKKKTPGAPR